MQNSISRSLKPVLMCAILASIIGLTIHIYLTHVVTEILNNSMKNVTILHPPYPFVINFWAYVTGILPGIGIAILYYLLNPSLKFKNRLTKGIVFSLLLLLAEGELIRPLIMNVLVGNPIRIALMQQLQTLIPCVVMCIIAAIVINSKAT